MTMKLTRKQLESFKDWLYDFFGDEDEVVCNQDNDELRRMFLTEIGEIEPTPTSDYPTDY